MAGFQLPFGVKPVNAVPVDYYSGPYTSTISIQDAIDLANSSIPQGIRFKTMEVRLIVNGIGVKYWYRDGIDDINLVEFTTSTSFYLQGGTTYSSDTTSNIYRTGAVNIGSNANSSSDAKLYVSSNQPGAFRLEDGTQGPGYLLTSDINGVAGWTVSNYLTIASASSPFYIQGGVSYSFDTTADIYRTGSLNIGSGTATNGRFVVSSSTGSVSLVIDNSGNVYNMSRGLNNTLFGYQAGPSTTGISNTAIGYLSLLNNGSGVSTFTLSNPGSGYTASSTYSNVQLSYISGSTASTYPIVTVFVGAGGTVSTVTLVTTGTGFIDTTTVMGANLGSSATFSISTLTISSGSYNVGVGAFSLGKNTTGERNTALGFSSLYNNVSGYYNTAVGYQTSFNNTTGQINVAIGYQTSYNNTTGQQNVAVGYRTLYSNAVGNFNTAIGQRALYSNIADKNTALGAETMFYNTTGTFNTALGQEALRVNTTGSYNTAVGNFALLSAQSDFSTALGREAGRYSSNATLIASTASLFLGYNSKSLDINSYNEVVIGATAVGNGSNSVTLGNDSITKTILKGNVGIGTASPSTKLHIYATQSGAFQLQDGSEGVGLTLISDEYGFASWTSSTILVTGTFGTLEPPYKVYTALLTQTGTNAPVATVLENSVPIDITYGYVAAGVFNVSFPYPSNIVSTKLAIILGKIMNEQSAGTYTYDSLGYSGGNITFNLKTKMNASTFSNYVLNNTFIEIRIYN